MFSEAPLPQDSSDSTTFGDPIPFGEPSWYQDWGSPYYNDSHRRYNCKHNFLTIRFRAAMRAWMEKEIMPYCHEWSENKTTPSVKKA